MLEALIAGTQSPAAMAELAKGRMRGKRPQLAEALTGSFTAHQRFLVARQLAHIDHLDVLVGEISDEITQRLRLADDAAVAPAATGTTGAAVVPVDAAAPGPPLTARVPEAATVVPRPHAAAIARRAGGQNAPP